MYGTLEQDLPDIGKSGGKLTFATTELNTAYTHELIDRMTIDSKGRMFHRSTAETGIAHNIFANNVNTGVPFKIQMSNLSSGIGVHITTEIVKQGPDNVTTFLDGGTLNVSTHIVAKYKSGDLIEINNCTYIDNDGTYIVRSSLGSTIHLQSLNGIPPTNLYGPDTTCNIRKPESIPTNCSMDRAQRPSCIYRRRKRSIPN